MLVFEEAILYLCARNWSNYEKTKSFISEMAVSKAEYISVRDEDSFLYLKEIGIKKDIELVPDPVLACQSEGMESEWLQKHSIQGKVIAVSVRYWDAKEDYMKKLADTLKKFKRDVVPYFIRTNAWTI